MHNIVNVVTRILVSFLLIGNVSAADLEILLNNVTDVEQFQNNRGKYLNIETNRIILEDIKSDFSIKFIIVPRAREGYRMVSNSPTCVVNNVKTAQRSQKYYFSLPVTLFSTLRVFQKNTDALLPNSLLNESGKIKSLVELLTLQAEKNILLVKDIEYPESLQPQIDLLNHKQVLFLKNSSLNGQNVRLLERERVNYIVDYPQVVDDWYLKQGTINKLKSYAIAGLEPFVAGYIVCNENAANSGVLEAINTSILKLYQNGSFYAIYAKYLQMEDVEQINQYFAELLNVDPYKNSSL